MNEKWQYMIQLQKKKMTSDSSLDLAPFESAPPTVPQWLPWARSPVPPPIVPDLPVG